MIEIPISPHNSATIHEIRAFIDAHCSLDTQIELKDTYLDTIDASYESPTTTSRPTTEPKQKMHDYREEVADQIKTIIRYVFGDVNISDDTVEMSMKWLTSNSVVFSIHLSFEDIDTFNVETV